MRSPEGGEDGWGRTGKGEEVEKEEEEGLMPSSADTREEENS